MNSIRCFLTAEPQRERFRILTETRFEAEDYHKDSVALQFQEMLFVTSFNLQPRKIILGSSIELPKKKNVGELYRSQPMLFALRMCFNLGAFYDSDVSKISRMCSGVLKQLVFN